MIFIKPKTYNLKPITCQEGFTPLETTMFYTYVLRSKKDDKFYTGATEDLRERFDLHNNGKILSTKGRGPFKLIYYEARSSSKDAFVREKYLKSGPGKRYLKNRLKRSLSLTGFSTLEVMIAMVILILAVTTVILVLFGGQSVTTDAQTNQEAIYMAQKDLEVARAKSRGTVAEFNSIVSTTATVSGDIYTKQLLVSNISDCAKRVTNNLNWMLEQRSQSISISSVLSSIKAFLASGSNCSVLPPPPDLKNPSSSHDPIIISTVSGQSIAVLNKIIYLGVHDSNENLDDLFIYDANDPSDPQALGSVAIDWGANKKLNGIIDLVAVDYQSLGKKYVFAAGVHGRFYDQDDSGPAGEEQASGQLQVIDVTSGSFPFQVASVSLPGVSGTCNATCPGGRSIAYYDGKIYVGTHRVAGPEFHIFDVATDPTNPIHLGNTGSIQVDHNINDIKVKGAKAYLATSSNTEEVIVLDVSVPGAITIAGTFDAKKADSTASAKDGRSLSISGSRIYLGVGRAVSALERDFYVVDENNLTTALGSKNFNMNQGAGISGIHVTDGLAFVSTRAPNKPFSIWDVSNSDPSIIVQWDTCPINFSVDPQNMVYENGVIYTVNNQQSELRIIVPSPVCI
ncbi:MAG: hypothetical protein A2831_00105 [Candidatus Yanofskybacteria bacterium RIFCSPHIGHO2_01_FULL_44_17]|uniref:GIY-YIG domain-containing protein n=1 Tax=Candidatus Yanofskybacteria bacterium RIFCSPHIGHO2_01_FULL_44_17 TaxID=1802668 RepID=A0A1F8ETW7_9BACT|nr:MAG: hypothetical protein A2831_00105 [Candidatus Yanofskybacteria bacterium RIFCSPHIGHO2_01_FULL_44_17]